MNSAGSAPFDEFIVRALARPGLSRQFEGAGNRLHYLEWPGPRNAPPLLLLHGFLAHAHWWDFVAPWLAEHHHVFALDFGGMGDSGQRDTYRLEDFLAEIEATVRHLGIAGGTIVGHSFGGRAMLHACAAHADLASHAIVVDSRLVMPDDPLGSFDSGRPRRRYASETEILARFALRPEEPCPSNALFHMGRASIRREDEGWAWKFDDRILRVFGGGPECRVDDAAAVAGLAAQVDLVYGELSRVVNAARAARLMSAVGRGRPAIALPCGYHHLPVSQPQPLLAALRALLLPPSR